MCLGIPTSRRGGRGQVLAVGFFDPVLRFPAQNSSASLAEAVKAYQLPPADYSLLIIEFGLLTSNSSFVIYCIHHSGVLNNLLSYRKEEVMSIMDSSMQPCAVASLLK